jgi:hypothetical protein
MTAFDTFLFAFLFLAGLGIMAFWIAAAFDDIGEQGRKARSAADRTRAAMAQEQAEHDAFMAKARADRLAFEAALEGIRNDPRWLKLQTEINAEYSALQAYKARR